MLGSVQYFAYQYPRQLGHWDLRAEEELEQLVHGVPELHPAREGVRSSTPCPEHTQPAQPQCRSQESHSVMKGPDPSVL